MSEKIAAVVVTYNRLPLLKKVIEGLLIQSRKLDLIIVVDNASTDGTKEWLDAQDSLHVIHQENLGGAGGFKTGLKIAYEMQFDWIWSMDDDVVSEPDCLAKLLAQARLPDVGILLPVRYVDGKPFFTEFKKLNLRNMFKDWGICRLVEEDLKNEYNRVQTMTFEGPFIKREVISNVGFPDPEYFILYDDTDYACRAIKYGHKIYMVSNAKISRVGFIDTTNSFGWKNLYDIHNSVRFDYKHGENYFVKHFRSVNKLWMYSCSYVGNVWRNDRFKRKDIWLMWKAYFRAHSGKLPNYKK